MTILEATGDAAILRAQIRQENAEPVWTERVALEILCLLRERGEASGELLVDLCKLRGFKPLEDRCFGACFQLLTRAGLIRQVGWTIRQKGHKSGGARVWAAV